MAEKQRGEIAVLKDRLERLKGFTYNMRFRFRFAGAGSKFPLVMENMSFRYRDDQPWILRNVNCDVKRGQVIAIMGDNGAGKTTLLNVMAQRLKPENGKVEQGHNVTWGYCG